MDFLPKSVQRKYEVDLVVPCIGSCLLMWQVGLIANVKLHVFANSVDHTLLFQDLMSSDKKFAEYMLNPSIKRTEKQGN